MVLSPQSHGTRPNGPLTRAIREILDHPLFENYASPRAFEEYQRVCTIRAMQRWIDDPMR